MSFAGWPGEAVEFFEDLEEDNTKSFWQANIETYEISVKRPTEELLAELEPEFGAGRLFRPYRDVRFSKDKSPYKTNHRGADFRRPSARPPPLSQQSPGRLRARASTLKRTCFDGDA
jgi:uncharacterized protein (DUF2461 family)